MAVFLREDGVLAMGNKTPVTILQETLQRRGLNPHYELVYNAVGTMDTLFKYQVSADGYTAIGEGKSKKEAKHDAAATILRRMQAIRAVVENEEIQGVEEVDIASPYSGALKQNFVGLLDETCVTNKIPFPVITPVSEAGPPHARVFQMQCNVSSVTETAVARTKKQAKHLVAQQMIGRIADILGDMYIPHGSPPQPDDDDAEVGRNLRAIESGSFRHDLSIPFSEMHNVFFLRIEEYPVPQEFLDLPKELPEFYEQMEKPKEFLNNLLQKLEGTCKVVLWSTKSASESLQQMDNDLKLLDIEDFDDDSGEEYASGVDSEQYSSCFPPLEEFSLEEFDSDDENSVTTSSQPTIPNGTSKAEPIKNKFNCEVFDKEIDQLQLKQTMNNKTSDSTCEKESDDNFCSEKEHVFLSVECPQGLWVFSGVGENHEEAVNIAAIEALKFLRVMAIPKNDKNPESSKN